MPADLGPMSKEFAEMFARAHQEYFEQVDPNNPWPPGCDWWHKHNAIYRRSRIERRMRQAWRREMGTTNAG